MTEANRANAEPTPIYSMSLFSFNAVGIALFLLGVGVSLAVRAVTGIEAEGGGMIVAGVVVAALDARMRANWEEGKRWVNPSAGGSVVYIPFWVVGVCWIGFGTYYLVSGESSVPSPF